MFRYGVATARTKSDPAALLRGALTAPTHKHLGAIVEPKRVGELLRAIEGYEGQPVTKLALKLSAHFLCDPANCDAPNGRKSTSKQRFGGLQPKR